LGVGPPPPPPSDKKKKVLGGPDGLAVWYEYEKALQFQRFCKPTKDFRLTLFYYNENLCPKYGGEIKNVLRS